MHTFSVDLNLLYEIVIVADASKQKGSFLSIFEAYDAVLRRKNIDSASDRIYYKFLLKLVQMQEQGWECKFKSLIKNMGIDFKFIKEETLESNFLTHRHKKLDYSIIPDDETSLKDFKDFFYNSDEILSNSSNSEIENSSELIKLKKQNIKSPFYNNNSISKNIEQAEYIYNKRCIQIKQEYFRIWVQKVKHICNNFKSIYSKAVLYDKYTLFFQTLKIWYKKSLYYEKVKNDAKNARNYVLMEKSFVTWIKKFYMKKKEHQHLYNFILMKVFLNAWRKIWIMQYKIAALYRLSFSFSIWKKKLSTQKNRISKIIRWQRLHILKRIFFTWLTKTYLNKLNTDKEFRRKQKTFLLWKWQFELICKKKETSIKNYSRKQTNYYYKLWLQKSKKNFKNIMEAILLSNKLNLIKTFRTWNIRYKTEISRKLFLSFKNTFLIKKYLLFWRRNTKNTQMAFNFSNYTLLHSTFLNWYQKLHLNILLVKLRKELKRKIIYKWILKERLTLLFRVKKRRVYYLLFYFWKERHCILNSKNILLISFLEKKNDYRIKTTTFLKWIKKLSLLKKKKKDADEIVYMNTKKNIINHWRKKNTSIQKKIIMAEYTNDRFYTKHSIIHWKKTFHKRVETRREKHINLFIYNRDHKLCHKIILYWRSCLKNIMLNHNIALKFRINKFQCLIIHFFNIWSNKYKFINMTLLKTQKENELEYIKSHFIKWKTKQNIIFIMYNCALTILIKKNYILIKKYLRKWELHILQLRGPEIQAYLFKKRQNTLFIRIVFYFWQQQLKKKLMLKKNKQEK